jgi:hypothetical protein
LSFFSKCLLVSGKRKNIISKFRNITKAGINPKIKILVVFIKAQNKGQITNQIPNVAQINQRFLVLFVSSEISDIYADQIAHQAHPNQEKSLAKINTHIFGDKAKSIYQSKFNQTDIFKAFLRQYMSDSFHKTIHHKSIHKEKIQNVIHTNSSHLPND